MIFFHTFFRILAAGGVTFRCQLIKLAGLLHDPHHMQGGNEAQIFESLSLLKKTVKAGTLVLPGHDHFGFNIEEN